MSMHSYEARKGLVAVHVTANSFMIDIQIILASDSFLHETVLKWNRFIVGDSGIY